MPDEYVIVMGSRFGATLPKIKAKKIYTANAAAEFGFEYKEKNSEVEHISVFGMHEFLKNPNVKEKIISSKPDRIIIRDFKFDTTKYFSEKTVIETLGFFKDLSIQSSFVKGGIIRLLMAEFMFSEKKGFINFFKMLKNKRFQGFSTGFLNILLAREENPNSKIIFSGIGLEQGGGHFYTSAEHKGFFSSSLKKNNSNNNRNIKRKLIDKYLFKYLNQKKLINLLTLDEDFKIKSDELSKDFVNYFK